MGLSHDATVYSRSRRPLYRFTHVKTQCRGPFVCPFVYIIVAQHHRTVAESAHAFTRRKKNKNHARACVRFSCTVVYVFRVQSYTYGRCVLLPVRARAFRFSRRSRAPADGFSRALSSCSFNSSPPPPPLPHGYRPPTAHIVNTRRRKWHLFTRPSVDVSHSHSLSSSLSLSLSFYLRSSCTILLL